MYNEIFASRARATREESGLTQQEAARTLKIGRSTLAHYETGTREPDLETLGKLADLYHVSIDWLVGRAPKDMFNATNEKNSRDILKGVEKEAKADQRHIRITTVNKSNTVIQE